MINSRVNYRDLEKCTPTSERLSYDIFFSIYRERYGNKWPEEWTYSADCVSRNSVNVRVNATGKEAFVKSIVRQLQGLTDFAIQRKKLAGVKVGIESYENHSKQVALPDDNELAELEVLIRRYMEENKKRTKQGIEILALEQESNDIFK
ncbi:hypothetical protein HYV49_06400 [Candidatus Pacearchaeota archaeon]|nr:hypothetical protein [Candidatus Pacearchaeota archaeon]